MSIRSLRNHALITSGLLFGLSAFSPSAFADPSTTIPLEGSIAAVSNVSSASTTEASNLPMTSAEQIVPVAVLTMSTNSHTGMKVSIPNGTLNGSNGGTISYKVGIVTKGTPEPSSESFGDSLSDVSLNTGAGTVEKDLYIQYTPDALQTAGTYTGSITVTVANN